MSVRTQTRPRREPPALVGRRIPSRSRSVRRLEVGIYGECSWRTVADLAATVRWGTLQGKFTRLAERLDGLDVLTAGDQPQKALGELRALSAEITKLESALGITAVARPGLGVNMRTPEAAAGVGRFCRGAGLVG